MPKKYTRHAHAQQRESASSPLQSSSSPATATTNLVQEKIKHRRSVHIGLTNGKRWLSLKKRLGYCTDDELVVYLLDLAESIAAKKDETCHDKNENWEEQCEEKEKENSEIDNPVQNIVSELPRRSARKLAALDEATKNEKLEKSNKPAGTTNTLEKVSKHDSNSDTKSHTKEIKTKRHKSKTRHHKEKRKKKKHQRNKELRDSVDRDEKISKKTLYETDSKIDLENREVQSEHISRSIKSSDSKRSHKILISKKLCYKLHDDIDSNGKSELSTTQNSDNKVYAQEETKTKILRRSRRDGNQESKLDKSTKILVDLSKKNLLLNTHSEKNVSKHKHAENNDCKDHEKSKKKHKHSNHIADNLSNPLDESNKNYCDESTSSTNKRDKKKHKGIESSKKHLDVRKAPENGIIEKEQVNTPSSQDLLSTTVIEDVSNDVSSKISTKDSEADPPRLAIKIKLCQDCNNRHLQDTCPLIEPEYFIKDTVTFDEWVEKHNDNSEVINILNCNDPMSQGYSKQDDSYESDDETEQYNAKERTECEEKQLNVEPSKPIYARDSLPDCLEFKMSNADHGLGVFVKRLIPMYAQLGPLIGKLVQEMDIPDDFTMRHIWEVDINNKTFYMSTTNPLISNWVRYVRPAETKEDRNVAVISKNGELFLVTSKCITAGTELTYWTDSHSTAWTRKNKIDKTNCGGCNLNFSHPIYYRLHCCIFHDTNYSLTIRKYHCKVCGAAVLGKDNIMKHATEFHAGRGAYQCQYCKKFFLRLNYLEMHRTYGCSQNPQRSRPLCDFCGRKFCQPQKLKVHIKRMHSDMSEVLREFQCKLCLKLLGSRAALQRHMKEVHHKDVVGAATCDRCGKMFQNKSNLKIHMLTHSGVKPFKCRENDCKAAFTTKQCLQFHYKKVHGLNEDLMPKIERSVAYTFDAYSGGLVEDAGRGKTPKFNKIDSQDNDDSVGSYDDCSSENTNPSLPEIPVKELPYNEDSNKQLNINEESNQQLPILEPALEPVVHNTEPDVDIYRTSRLHEKENKKWSIEEFNTAPSTPPATPTVDIYDFEDNRKEPDKMQSSNQNLIDQSKLSIGMYRKTESASASLLVEAALDAAEREIGAVSSPILEDSDRETANLYSISNELDFKVACSHNQQMHKSSPDRHLDAYMRDDLASSPLVSPHPRHTPPNQIHVDYHIHRSVDYVNAVTRTHSIEQYLNQVSQEVPTSPTRYQEIPHLHSHVHHHQIASDALSSDDGDSVAQNLSLPIKEKSMQQIELAKYDGLETDFSLVSRERMRFEPLIVQSAGEQGLDMSARGFHQTFGVQNNTHHHQHHHHQHLYEVSEHERQGVDLSRTASCISPPTYPPSYPSPYSHVEIPRVVSLEPSSRSHHLHTSVSRIIASPPAVNSLTSHLVAENLETRMLSPPPPSMPGYNTTYSSGSSSYHTSRSGYHYSGYY